MRKLIVFILALAVPVGNAGAAPVLSREDRSPAYLFPPLPGGPFPSNRPEFGISDPDLRTPGTNPGVTAPLVSPGSPTDDKSPPITKAGRLDELFQRLSHADDGEQAKSIALAIQHVWLESGSDTADLLMMRVVAAVGKGEPGLAIKLLDKIVIVDPSWVEAWNKRATLRFLSQDDVGAMEDIAQVLTLEPRHFGALSGMGFILQRNGMKKEALALVRKAAAIYPHNTELEKLQSELTLDVEGRET